jgi:hypothetical protein
MDDGYAFELRLAFGLRVSGLGLRHHACLVLRLSQKSPPGWWPGGLWLQESPLLGHYVQMEELYKLALP